MSLDEFWAAIDTQRELLRKATTNDAVLRICPAIPGVASGDGFFGGSGGGGSIWGELSEAGWEPVWSDADYYWCMRAPNGDMLTYVEGDLYRGNSRSRANESTEEDDDRG